MMDDDDTAFAKLRLLPQDHVSASREHRLRGMCHAELRRRTAPGPTPRPVVGPALIGVWSAIYLLGMLRSAAALYGF